MKSVRLFFLLGTASAINTIAAHQEPVASSSDKMRLPFSSSSEKAGHSPASSERFEQPHDVPYQTEGYDDDLHVECPPHTTERKLVSRIDYHIIPVLCILYLLAFLDRVNISNANVFGLSKELELEGNQYNVALVIFFVPYVL